MTTSSPRVAVVVPAWRATGTIAATMASVRAQTLAEWELVVVDDGSDDGTAEAAEAAAAGDPRIRVVRQPHSGLPAAGRNRGIRETRAPLIAFLDADDVWLPAKLERQVALLDADPGIGVVHCLAVHVSSTGEAQPELPPTPPGEGAMLAVLAARNIVHNSAVLLRRELLDRYGLLDEHPRLRGSEDYELWLRVAPHTRFACVEEALLRYRVHERGISNDRRAMDAGGALALELALKREPEAFHRLGAGYLRNAGIARCAAGLPGRGRALLARSLLREPGSAMAWRWLALSLVPAATVPVLRRLAGRA